MAAVRKELLRTELRHGGHASRTWLSNRVLVKRVSNRRVYERWVGSERRKANLGWRSTGGPFTLERVVESRIRKTRRRSGLNWLCFQSYGWPVRAGVPSRPVLSDGELRVLKACAREDSAWLLTCAWFPRQAWIVYPWELILDLAVALWVVSGCLFAMTRLPADWEFRPRFSLMSLCCVTGGIVSICVIACASRRTFLEIVDGTCWTVNCLCVVWAWLGWGVLVQRVWSAADTKNGAAAEPWHVDL